MSGARPVLAAIEAGGTKCVVAMGYGHDAPQLIARVPTTDPVHTFAEISAVLAQGVAQFGPLAGLGVAAFGPLQLDTAAANFARVLATPKSGWAGADWRSLLAQHPGCAFAIDTDVNAAALAEHRWGAAMGCDVSAYVTVGTGIGGGVVVRGRSLRGLLHPELGHLRLRRHPQDVSFHGVCPFHGDCLEGVASGPAITARCGTNLSALDDSHPLIDVVADSLAQLCAHLLLVLSTQCIVLGGGVLGDARLLPRIRRSCGQYLNGYLGPSADTARLETLIRAPGLAEYSGLAGAFLLADQALDRG